MNKRRHPRQRAGNVAAHLRVENRTTLSSVEDISESGLFIRTLEDLPVGMVVSVDLARPGLKKVLHLTGTVARRSSDGKKGIGIAFDGLDDDTRARLGKLIGDLGGTRAPEAPADRFAPIELPLEAKDIVASEPTPAQKAPPAPEGDQAKLFIQIRGLLMELGTRDQALRQKDDEITRLQAELAAARDELASLRARASPGASEALRRETAAALAHLQAVAKLVG